MIFISNKTPAAGPGRNTPQRGAAPLRMAAVIGLLVASLCALPSPASAQAVYWSRDDLLRSFFADSDTVRALQHDLTGAERAALRHQLGAAPADRYTIYYGLKGGAVRGYALIDNERGQHLPITFGVLADAQGRLQRLEVMVYRESHGDAVRRQRFRDQFVGRGPHDGFRPGHDVATVSGATISSKALARGAQRALKVIDALVLTRSARAARPAATTGRGG